MTTALAYHQFELLTQIMPRPARHVHLYLAAVDGVIVATDADRSANPTVTDYDVLDRATLTTLPDKTWTKIDYGFDTDAFGKLRFSTTVQDTNLNKMQSMRDVRELITTVVEENRPFGKDGKSIDQSKTPIVTKYRYDPLKQITEVVDAQGNADEPRANEPRGQALHLTFLRILSLLSYNKKKPPSPATRMRWLFSLAAK